MRSDLLEEHRHGNSRIGDERRPSSHRLRLVIAKR
jgi:hypothetical protein